MTITLRSNLSRPLTPDEADGNVIDLDARATRVAPLGTTLGVYELRPQQHKATAGLTNGTIDDRDSIVWCITLAQAAGIGRAKILLGSLPYRCSGPIGTLLTKPFHMEGEGAWFIYDVNAVGDFLSFSNCWYGADITVLSNGTTVTNSTDGSAVTWPNQASRKNGITLKGFTVVGDRRTTQTQNGIVFYDRNDYVFMEDVEVHFIKGYGIVFSGVPSNAVTNRATVMRESFIQRVQTRWCGDRDTGRPAMVFNCATKTAISADDSNNYNKLLDCKSIFPNGIGFQTNCHSLNTGSSSNNVIQIQIDFPVGASGASQSSGFSSITNGVLSILTGGSITGTFGIGQFLANANIPLGTYISSQLTGTAGAVGTYQLANRTEDISTLTVASGSMGTLRAQISAVQIGGGHTGDKFDLTINASNAVGTGAVGVELMQNVLHGNTQKMSLCDIALSCGAIDVGVDVVTASTANIKWSIRGATTSMRVGNITKQIVVDLYADDSAAGFSITGSTTNLTVRPGGQDVIYGTVLPSASKYPNAFLILNNSGTITRNVSIAGSWVAA